MTPRARSVAAEHVQRRRPLGTSQSRAVPRSVRGREQRAVGRERDASTTPPGRSACRSRRPSATDQSARRRGPRRSASVAAVGSERERRATGPPARSVVQLASVARRATAPTAPSSDAGRDEAPVGAEAREAHRPAVLGERADEAPSAARHRRAAPSVARASATRLPSGLKLRVRRPRPRRAAGRGAAARRADVPDPRRVRSSPAETTRRPSGEYDGRRDRGAGGRRAASRRCSGLASQSRDAAVDAARRERASRPGRTRARSCRRGSRAGSRRRAPMPTQVARPRRAARERSTLASASTRPSGLHSTRPGPCQCDPGKK